MGPCSSRDEAIAEAIVGEVYTELEPDEEHPEWRISIHVSEILRPSVSMMTLDGKRVLEDLDELRYPEWRFFTGVTNKQEDDLTNRLTTALHEWARVNNIEPYSWCAVDSRNDETVVLPHPANEQ